MAFLTRSPLFEPELPSTAGAAGSAPSTPRVHAQAPKASGAAADPIPVASKMHEAEARVFTEGALRLTLEVVDGRRATKHLDSVMDPVSVGAVRARAGASKAARSLGVARMVRAHVRMVEPAIGEVFGSYRRGSRVFAVAGRVTRSTNGRWSLSSLRLV